MDHSRAAQKLLENRYVLKKILEHLNPNEQLQLLDTCESVRYVIVEVIWKVRFRTLHMYQTPYVTLIAEAARQKLNGDVCEQPKDDFMELNKIKEAKIALNTQMSKRFLEANAKNVRFLKVFSEYYDNKDSLGVTMNNIQMFRDLLHLSYHKMVVTNEQVKLVAENCQKLQRVEFIECFSSDMLTLIPGDNLSIENFKIMCRLDTLIIHSDASVAAPRKKMCSDILLQLLNELKLKCLQLKNIAVTASQCCESGMREDAEEVVSENLQILDIGCISDEFWPKFKRYLRKLSNLRDLSIKVVNCNTPIDIQIVGILAATCQKLERLSLENCDLLVENFCIFENLRHLSLTGCGGFTFANLQQVMGGLQLECLILINTRVLGVINHIYVSPSLQSITIDTILFTVISEAFQKSLNKFENLHTLNWLNGDINDNWIIDKCPNLRVLNIPNPYLLRRVAFTMKSLQEFTFTSCKGLSWRIIWILIKNLTLKRLNLQTHDQMEDHKEIPESAHHTKTTLRMIIIPFGIFRKAQKFWLDLLGENDRLKILFYGNHEELLHMNFMHNLLRPNYFPARVKYVKICGFTIDISDCRNKLMEVICRLNKNTSHYRTRGMQFTMEI